MAYLGHSIFAQKYAMKQIIITITFILAHLSLLTAQIWTTSTDIPIPVRAGNTAAYTSNGTDAFLFITSGRMENGQLTKKTQRLDLANGTWSERAPHPTGLLGGATAVLRDSLYVVGGVINPPGVGTNKVYRYNINADTWLSVANFPIGIVDAKAVTYQDSLVYVGGGFGGGTGGKVYLYNAHKNQWRVATTIPSGTNLNFGGFAVTGDTLIYMCGTSAFGSASFFNTVHVGVIDQNNRANIVWSLGTPFPGNTRTFFDAHAWQQGIVMTGGSTDNTFNTPSGECYTYDAGKDTWTALPNKPTPWLTGQSASVRLANGQWRLLCTSGYNATYLAETEVLESTQPVGIAPIPDAAHFWLMSQNPTPRAAILTVQYEIPETARTVVLLTNVMGQNITTMEQGTQGPGIHTISISTDTLPAGRYQIHLQAGERVLVRPVFLVK